MQMPCESCPILGNGDNKEKSVHTLSTGITPPPPILSVDSCWSRCDSRYRAQSSPHQYSLTKQPAWLACVRYRDNSQNHFPLSKEKSGKNLPNHGLEIWVTLEGGISPVL